MNARAIATMPADRSQGLAKQVTHRASPDRRKHDAYEKEADRAADAVSTGQRTYFNPHSASSADASAKGGRPMAADTRAAMETGFGASFSDVRIHADGDAASSARRMGALAYADGEHLYFDANRYRPQSQDGRHLLSHELAHVLQQRDGAPRLQRKAATPDPLTYDTTNFTVTPPAAPITLADAQQLTQDVITSGELLSVKVSGATAGSTEEIMLHVILSQTGMKDRWGTEIDMIAPIGFPPTGGGAAPVGKVTVRIDPKGNAEAVLISAGAVVMPATHAKIEDAKKDLTDNYGIAKFTEDGSVWTVEELNIVLGAFARLPKGDVKALKGVILERVTAISGDEGPLAGEFATEQNVSGEDVTNTATLRLADEVFPATQSNFTGGKANAAASGYLTILHEVGHAVEVKAKRDLVNAQFTAVAAHNPLVDKQNEAADEQTAAADVLTPIVEEGKAIQEEIKTAKAELAAAKTAKDTAAIATAQQTIADKQTELAAKVKEAAAARKPYEAAEKKTKAAKKLADAANTKRLAATTKARAVTVFPELFAKADAERKKAVPALARAKALASGMTPDSEAYREAADAAGKALQALTDELTNGRNPDDAQTEAQTAVGAMEAARDSLQTDKPGDPAIAAYAGVATAQRAWLDALDLTISGGGRTQRVKKFVDFVTAQKIAPLTKYAADNWPDKPEEFYAEAYSIFLSDPEYLKTNAPSLHDWFKKGKHL